MIPSVRKLIILILIGVAFMFAQINGKIEGPLKKVKCFECNSTHKECNYLEYINNNYKFLTNCEDNINNHPQCYVAFPLEQNFPKPERGCREEGYECPQAHRCCFCSKHGCNGNNRCTGSSACGLWQLSKPYIGSLLIVVFLLKNMISTNMP